MVDLGFERLIAFRWLELGEIQCRSTNCWAMYVIPRERCSSVYVSLSIEDRKGKVIGDVEDSVRSVAAGKRVKLQFETADRRAWDAYTTEMRCN